MYKRITLEFGRFAPHEREYMFNQLYSTRPWAFLEMNFPRPPRRAPYNRYSIASKDFYVVSDGNLTFQMNKVPNQL